jgi:hypothetical protein
VEGGGWRVEGGGWRVSFESEYILKFLKNRFVFFKNLFFDFKPSTTLQPSTFFNLIEKYQLN